MKLSRMKNNADNLQIIMQLEIGYVLITIHTYIRIMYKIIIKEANYKYF